MCLHRFVVFVSGLCHSVRCVWLLDGTGAVNVGGVLCVMA